MGELVRSLDWSQTPLGPTESWPQSLKTAVWIMLNSRYPMFVWWGSELIHFYNDGYIPVLGARHPAALGRRAPEVWSEIWPRVGPQAEIVLREGRATWDEEVLLVMERNQFIEETYFTYSYSPLPNDEGGIGGVFCACTEDTQRVLGQRRLRTLRGLAERAAEAKSAEGALRLAARTLADNPHDLPFTLLYLLDGGRRARLVGHAGLEPGTPASPAVLELESDDAPWPLRRVADSGEAVQVTDLAERFGPLPGGAWPEPTQRAVVLPMAKPGQVELAGFLVAGASPRLAFTDDYHGFLELLAGHIATAIANARAHEEERRRADALAELDRAKTTFFGNVSHELRTPLTLILGPLEDLLASAGDLEPATREHLHLVHRNALRLLRLVNTLLDFSRIEAGRLEASYVPADLASLTADLASNFRSACDKASLDLVVDCPPLPEPVYVDRNMWEAIVLNLVSNAFKFTFEGGITVSLCSSAGGAVLEVSDTGVGIPEDELPHLFERFHRVESTHGRTHEGTGIGLALVQELVRLHGGTLGVASEPGRGSTFTVTLPLGADHLPADRIAGPPGPLPTATGAAAYVEEALRWLPDDGPGPFSDEEPPDARLTDFTPGGTTVGAAISGRILAVDDNADMRDYLRHLLAPRFEVETAGDGVEALAAVRRRPPDLVLADLMMPRLDGFGLLRALRSDPRTRSVPVILLSARAGEEARVEGLDAGADDYMVKPFSARELSARVEALLKMAKLRRESEVRFRTMADVAPAILWLADEQAWCTFLSCGWYEHTGQREDEGQGLGWLEAVHPDDRGRTRQIYAAAQVIGNLLNNAARYTPRGGRIRLTAERRGSEVVVSVKDTGIGLAADQLTRIFGLFSQVEHSPETAHGGLGIGLTLVERLVELHGGRVEVKSEGLGKGAEFLVHLPVAESEPATESRPREDREGPVVSTTPLRLLVVDDNRDAADSLREMLEFLGHEARTAYDGEQALEVAESYRPEVVLLDIGLPKMDGYEVGRRLRSQPWGRDTVLIAITGWGQDEDKRRSKEAGFDHHLVKPIDPRGLMGMLTEVATSG